MKIDFHIHTTRNKYLDTDFEFDENAIKSYVIDNGFEAIAITNHNLFDEKQFKSIADSLKDTNCLVFPGIEISLEDGHILVIGENCIESIDVLNEISRQIGSHEIDDHYAMSINEFNQLLPRETDFLLIPHYMKDPKISKSVLAKIETDVFVGEAQSPKKFYSIEKENKYTPVYFSDIRIKKTGSLEEFSKNYLKASKYTYLKCETKSFRAIKQSLRNKNSTSLTKDFDDNSFEILNGEARASLGINVLLGKRSSGKTYTLDHIYGQGNCHTLYIKQFDIVEKCKETDFLKFLERHNDETVIRYLQELNNIFDYINEFPDGVLENELTDYLRSLIQSAQQQLDDAFSKAPLFQSYALTSKKDQASDVYKACDQLLSANGEYQSEIFNKISKNDVIELYLSFVHKAKDIYLQNKTISKTNEITNLIGQQLEKSSTKIRIKPINFEKIFKYRYIKTKFDNLINSIEKNEISSVPLFGKFITTIDLKRERNKAKLKSNLKIGTKGNVDYLISNNPYSAYFLAKEDTQIKSGFGEQRYNIFFSIERNVKTVDGFSLSGGQKAEFILLSELADYRSYDMILIDEMESSFDNPFLNSEINSTIKEMSKNAIVFISTHNNNLGVSLNPDYYIYHQIVLDDENKQILHEKYCGSSSSIKLSSKNGKSLPLSNVLITTMEANENAYQERKNKYENS